MRFLKWLIVSCLLTLPAIAQYSISNTGSAGGASSNLPFTGAPVAQTPIVVTNTIQPTFFGMSYTSTWPQLNFGSLRLWNTNTRWQQMEPSAGTYNFSTLNTYLQTAYSYGIKDVVLTLSATPSWASSDPTNTTCNFSSTSPGSCGAPLLLNSDGTGTNQYWRDFIYNLGSDIVSLNTSQYSTVGTFEIWEGFTSATSWEGTDAQLVRMSQDARCILLGTGVITATGQACSSTNMNEPLVGILPKANITLPNVVMTSPASSLWTGYLATTGALSAANIAPIQTYIQPSTCCSVAENLVPLIAAANSDLTAAGWTQPLWSTEGSWGISTSEEPDPNLEAAFLARYYILGVSNNLARMYWYAYDNSTIGTLWNANGVNGCNDGGTGFGCVSDAGVAYNTLYGWLVGGALVHPCAVTGTVWTCTLTTNSGSIELVWDSSQTCSNGTCTTSNFTYPSEYTNYMSLNGVSTTIGSGVTTVPIGAEPICLGCQPPITPSNLTAPTSNTTSACSSSSTPGCSSAFPGLSDQ
jgi:Beta-galactosidase